MADKVVSVVLEAKVAGFKAQMAQASAAVKGAGAGMVGTLDAAQKKSVAFGDAYRKSMDTRHIRAFDIAGAGLVATLGLAVAKAAGFEKSLSLVKAVSGATAGEMEQLRQAALDAGQASVFSASESADAIAELSKAGVSTANILGGALTGALDLAAAGGLGLADAATIAAQAMNTFELSGRDVTHIADVLAAGANKSAADVDTLAQAMRQGGLVAKQTGLSLEDTAGVLSLFADNALVGSDAGTSLKTMLQRLTPQSKQAQKQFDALGISAYDAQGNFVGIDQLAGQLHDRLKDLSPQARNAALSVMFGSDAVRAASVLYQAGADGVREYVNAVDDTGAASRMASEMTDNLAGDIERLSGAIETGLIKGGTGANDVLRWMTQRAETAADAVSSLPAPILGVTLGVTGLSGAFLLLAPRIMATVEALKAMREKAGIGGILKGGAKAVGVAAVAMLGVEALGTAKSIDDLIDKGNELREAYGRPLGAGGGLLSDIGRQAQENLKATQAEIDAIQSSWLEAAKAGIGEALKGNFSFDTVASDRLRASLETQATTVREYNALLSTLQAHLGMTADDAAALADEAKAAGVSMNGTWRENAAAVEAWAHTTNAGNKSVQVSMAETANAATRMSDVLLGAFGLLDERGKKRAFQAAIDAATKALKDNGRTLDINTAKGRTNQAALDDIARTTLDLATTKTKEGEVIVSNARALARGREEYVKVATNMGMSRKAAERLANQVFGTTGEIKDLNDELAKIPKKKNTDVTADTSQASAAIRSLQIQLNNLSGNAGVQITGPHGSGRITKAQGGPIVGPGTGTSDSVPIWASNGEYVIKAQSVAKYGRHVFDSLNAGRFATGGQVGDRKREIAQRIQDRMNQRGSRYLDYFQQVRDSVRSFGALSGSAYDPQREADAMREQASAAQALANAQDRLNKIRQYAATATDPRARANALALEADAQDALAQATGRLAAADQSVAASRPSAQTYLAQQSASVKTAKQFLADAKTLKGWGLRGDVIADLFSRGPDEGGAIARALVEGGKGAVGTANAQQRQLNRLAKQSGKFALANQYGTSLADARGMAGVVVTFAKGAFDVRVDGEVGAATERRIEAAAEKGVRKALGDLQGAGKGGKRGGR